MFSTHRLNSFTPKAGAGGDHGRRYAARIAFMNARLVTGSGAVATYTPLIASSSRQRRNTRSRSAWWIQETHWSPKPIVPPRPSRVKRTSLPSAPPPGPSTKLIRRATPRCEGSRAASKASSQATPTRGAISSMGPGGVDSSQTRSPGGSPTM